MKKLLSVSAVLLLILFTLSGVALAGNGTVKDGVINLSVKIEDNVKEDSAIIDNIIDRFSDASKALYIATAKQNRLGTIKIIVPSAWSAQNGAQAPGDMDLQKADVKILNGSVGSANVNAFGGTGNINLGIMTLKHAGCGKTIVHEFGHYGYGLYDEYMASEYRKDLTPPGWYMKFKDDTTGWFKCTGKVAWEVEPLLCYWYGKYRYPKSPSSPEDNHACIMWFQHDRNINQFCNEDHNSSCNCDQNIHHDFKSCWAVMKDCSKFSLKLPGDSSLVEIDYKNPEFEIIQPPKSRYASRAVNIGIFSSSVEAGGSNVISVPIDSTINKAGFVAAGANAASLAFSLVTPGGATITPESLNGAQHTGGSATLTYTITAPEVGNWQMKVSNSGDYAQAVTLTANDVSDSTNQDDPIILVEGGTEKTVYSTPEPIRICAAVTREYVPVHGAAVYAIVKRPDGSEVKVPLSDDDTGGDLMPADGSYEGSFSSFNGNGNYAITVVADNSEGSAVEGWGLGDDDLLEEDRDTDRTSDTIAITENFRRQCELTAVQVSGYTGLEKFPPGEIEQLTAALSGDSAVKLTWIATGSSEYAGQAASYDLRYSAAPITTDGEWDNASRLYDLPVPKSAGEPEEYTTPILAAGTYYFALSARSGEGILSPRASVAAIVSNGYQSDTYSGVAITDVQTSGRSGCFIATAAFGSPVDPYVMSLRRFRDAHLLTSLPGRYIVGLYYRVSPPIAAFISQSQPLRTATCILLLPVVFTVENPLWGFLAVLSLTAAAIMAMRHLKDRKRLKAETEKATSAG